MHLLRALVRMALTGFLAVLISCSTGNDNFIIVDSNHQHASDNNTGSRNRPMLTISGAVKLMQAGDECLIREGIYREKIEVTLDGTAEKPVILRAAKGETVILSGTERLNADWKQHQGDILVTETDLEFEQLFANGRMMVEARWPNADPEYMLDRDTWAYAEEGSQHGWMNDVDLAESGLDASGAVVWLGVAHQFFSWSRKVSSHTPGEPVFTYPADLDGLGRWATIEWPVQQGESAPRYILMGKLAFLDRPGEWHLDRDAGKLYIWPPDGIEADRLVVEVKQRDLALDVSGDHVEVYGMTFFGSTFRYHDCNHGKVENVHLLYPNYQRLFGSGSDPGRISSTHMAGDHHTILRSSLLHSSLSGLAMSGDNSRIEQCLVRDFCWTGSLHSTGISAGGGRNSEDGGAMVLHNTVHSGGNSLMSIRSTPNNRVSYNHLYDGGRACKDVSLLYTDGPGIRGTEFSYNWVHDCAAPHIALGIRGDDQTRGLIIHHNVVWNIAWEAIIVKGDENMVYNNTCFNNDYEQDDYSDIMLFGNAEPKKPWRKQWPLLEVQNMNSLAFNNLGTIRGNRSYDPIDYPGSAFNNTTAKGSDPKELFKNPDQFDFRPVNGSPWIDAGTVPEGFNLEFNGKAPDLGAYESGSDPWRAGCDLKVVQDAEIAKIKSNQLLFK